MKKIWMFLIVLPSFVHAAPVLNDPISIAGQAIQLLDTAIDLLNQQSNPTDEMVQEIQKLEANKEALLQQLNNLPYTYSPETDHSGPVITNDNKTRAEPYKLSNRERHE